MSRYAKTSGERRGQVGFTLVEVLVAFLILAMALGVLLPSFSTGLRVLDRSAFQAAALAEARSQIERVGIEIPLEEGESTGRSDAGLEWTIRLHRHQPLDARAARKSDSSVISVYEVEAVVSDARDRTLTIRTLRVEPGK